MKDSGIDWIDDLHRRPCADCGRPEHSAAQHQDPDSILCDECGLMFGVVEERDGRDICIRCAAAWRRKN